MGPLFADRPQQLSEKPVNLVLDLNEPSRLSTPVPAQGLRDNSQPNLLVGLTATHGALRQKDQVAPLARRVIEQLH